MKSTNLNSYFTPHTKITLIWIISLNVISEIINFLEENTGEYDLGVGTDFLSHRKQYPNKKKRG